MSVEFFLNKPFSNTFSYFPEYKVVQSGGKNIELAVMRRNQPLKVKGI